MPLPYVTDAVSVLIAYAAISLSVMGAVHWGAAMPASGRNSSRYLIISVIPALTAWVALVSPAIPALGILLFGFIALYLYDTAVEKSLDFPAWYIPMRKNLTIIVAVCLTSTSLSVVLKE